jgi:hypothetical protein
MGWIACVRCQKFGCEFVARTFALIAPVQPISHRVSCSDNTIQNAPKHYKTHQFMSLASNGVDRVRSLRKTVMRFRVKNFFINCTSSTRFAVTKQIQNAPKQYETNQYLSLGSNGVDRVHSLRKIPMRLNGTNLSINCTMFRIVTKHCQMHRNTTKCSRT